MNKNNTKKNIKNIKNTNMTRGEVLARVKELTAKAKKFAGKDATSEVVVVGPAGVADVIGLVSNYKTGVTLTVSPTCKSWHMSIDEFLSCFSKMKGPSKAARRPDRITVGGIIGIDSVEYVASDKGFIKLAFFAGLSESNIDSWMADEVRSLLKGKSGKEINTDITVNVSLTRNFIPEAK